ncbi:MAG: hypothetical protein U1F83_04750 [Verrucomicrobiota bacterium]
MFQKKVVASVTGIGGMAGAVGGILIAYTAGLLSTPKIWERSGAGLRHLACL